MRPLGDRVAIITGAGRGLGRAYALFFAARGARVVVNDLGTDTTGDGADQSLAARVVQEIEDIGGLAIASSHDVADWAQARELIELAVDSFGGLDVLVNNAGVLRDRTLAKMTEDEWDVVVRTHLKGAGAMTKHAMEYWTARGSNGLRDASLIQVSSSSGFSGKFGQANYGAAKMGVIALSRIASLEGARFGVRSNVVAPLASTRLVLTIPGRKPPPEDIQDPMSARHVAPLVGWLASATCHANSQVFHVYANRIVVLEIAHVAADLRTTGEWTMEELDDKLSSKLVEPRDLAYFLPPRDKLGNPLPPEG